MSTPLAMRTNSAQRTNPSNAGWLSVNQASSTRLCLAVPNNECTLLEVYLPPSEQANLILPHSGIAAIASGLIFALVFAAIVISGAAYVISKRDDF